MLYANTDVAKMPVCILSVRMYVDCTSEARKLKLGVAERTVPLRGRREGGENQLNCEYVTLSRQTSSTHIAKHCSFIKSKFLQNFCSSCKTLANQVTRNPRFNCTCTILNKS
jgi:hypothetical protein